MHHQSNDHKDFSVTLKQVYSQRSQVHTVKVLLATLKKELANMEIDMEILWDVHVTTKQGVDWFSSRKEEITTGYPSA